MTQSELKNADMKVIYMCGFQGFPIDSHVKISKCRILFLIWSIAKKSNSLYPPMVSNGLIINLDETMKTLARVAFWDF